MKAVFVDTNIILDLLADRKPFSKWATELFSKAEAKEIVLYTSSHSIATTHYLLKKYIAEKELRVLLSSLLEYLKVIAIDEDIMKKALKSKHKDFEDAIQIIAAHSVGNLDFLVTRNLKDFKDAGLTVLPPDELLNFI